MKTDSIVTSIEQIKNKIRIGDLLTASEMLDITPAAAGMRLKRCKNDIINVIHIIISNREKLIQEYKESLKS